MGLFGKNYNKIEKELLKIYSNDLAIMGIPDSRRTAKGLLGRAIEKSKKEETYNLPSNFGNIILKEEKAEDPIVEETAERIRRTLPGKRTEGVRDEDIKWWWNLNDVERSIIVGMDEFNRTALILKFIGEDGLSPEEAGGRVWKHHPKYTYGYCGKMKKMPKEIEDNFPLPIELKDRINIYIEKSMDNPNRIKTKIEGVSSFNALIRKEIKAGNI